MESNQFEISFLMSRIQLNVFTGTCTPVYEDLFAFTIKNIL